MIYTTLGKTGFRVSRLGFGAMRFPMKDGNVDRELAIPLIHRAFESGVNIIDTAIGYCNSDSERTVGEALQGWRGRVVVSTKNHYYGADEKTWWTHLENSLERLQVAAIDIYNLHGIRWETFENRVQGPNGVLSWARKAYDQDLIRHICCSFHDTPENLRKIAETGEFGSIILQYSLLYRDLEPVLPVLKERNIGVIIMGPVGGGRLGGPSEQLRDLIPGSSSTAEVALRFVLANPNVDVALSGMAEMAQVEENCAIASRPEPLSPAEKEHVEEAMAKYKALADLYCTGCDYCLPCPAEVQIPRNFTIANLERVYGLADVAREHYGRLPGKASFCIACGACEERCPQGIPIREQLRDTARRLDEDYGKVRVQAFPEALDLSPAGARAGVRFHLHNLSDQQTGVQIKVRPRPDQRVDREDASVDRIPPLGRADVRFHLEQGRSSGFRGLDVSYEVASSLGEESAEIRLPVAVCLPRPHAARTGATPRVDETTPLRIDDPAQIIEGDPALLSTHGLQASAWHDKEALFLELMVRDDGARVASGRDEQGMYDGAYVLMDWRQRSHPVAPRMADGIYLFSLHPCDRAETTAFAVCRRGGADVGELQPDCRRCPDGYYLSVRFPYGMFGVSEPQKGNAIGFDLGLQSADPDGNRVFLAVWSGKHRVFRSGRGGYLFFQ